MSGELKDFLYVFQIEQVYNELELNHILKDKMPNIEEKLSKSGIYLLDWNFDDELKYLFIIVRCYGEKREDAGSLLENALRDSIENVKIRRKSGVLETRRIAFSDRRKLLAMLMLNLVKEHYRELIGYLVENRIDISWISECYNPRLAFSLLFLCHLSEGFSEDLSELYLLHYPIFLNEYSFHDTLQCINALTRRNLLSQNKKRITLSNTGLEIVQSIYRFLESKYSEARSTLLSIFQTFQDINSSLEKIIKRDGTFEDFRLEKIIASTLKCGVREDVVFGILNDLIVIFKLMGNLSRADVVEAVKFSLDKIDGSREYSSKFEFYVNTFNYVVLLNEKGRFEPFTVPFIKKMIRDRWFKNTSFRISDRIVDSIASKTFENIRFIYSSISPFIPLTGENKVLAEVQTSFVEKIIEKELELQLPYFYRILKSQNPLKEAEKVIHELVARSELDFSKVLEEERLSAMVELFNIGAYNLVTALMIFLNLVPSISHISNCTILKSSIKELRKTGLKMEAVLDRSLLNRINAFARASLKIFYLDTSLEAKNAEKIADYVKANARLGLKICKFLISRD